MRFPGPHALDHHHRLGRGQRIVGDLLLQLALGEHPWVLAVEVFVGRCRSSPRCHHQRAVVDRPLFPVLSDGRAVLAWRAVARRQLGTRVKGDPVLSFDLCNQGGQRGLRVIRHGQLIVNVAPLAAQLG